MPRPWLLLFLSLALAPHSARGCSCFGPRSFCDAPPNVDSRDVAVFLGTVEDSYPESPRDYYRQVEGYFKNYVGRRAILSADDPAFLKQYWNTALSPAELKELETGDSNGAVARFFGGTRSRARLRVTEVFAGPVADSFTVFSGLGESDCGFRLRTGLTYLVVANRVKPVDRWVINVCAPTGLAANSAIEIEALRAWKRGRPLSGLVYGSVSDVTHRTSARTEDPRDLPGVKVRLTAPGVSFETLSASNGAFSFRDIPPAKYVIEAVAPGWAAHPAIPNVVDLSSHRCQARPLALKQAQSTVRGRLLTHEGRSARGLAVALISVSDGTNTIIRSGQSDPTGYFKIPEVEPGDYFLALNPNGIPTTSKGVLGDHLPDVPYPALYFPGVAARAQAQSLHLERGHDADLPPWRLPPPLKEHEFRGIVRWTDGTPVRDAHVALVVGEGPSLTVQRGDWSDKEGRFSIFGFPGVPYVFKAIAYRGAGPPFFFGETPLPADPSAAVAIVLSKEVARPAPPFHLDFSSLLR